MAIEQDSAFLRLPIEVRLQIYNYAAITGIVTVTSAPSWNNVGTHIPGLPSDERPVVQLGYHKDLLLPALSSTLNPLYVRGPTTLSAARDSPDIPGSPTAPGRRHSVGLNSEEADFGSLWCLRNPDQERFQSVEWEYLIGASSRRYSLSSAETTVPRTDSIGSLPHNAKDLQPGIQVREHAEQNMRVISLDNLYLISNPYSVYDTFSSLRLTSRQIHKETCDHSYNSFNPPLDLYLSYPEGVCVVMHHYPHLLRSARTVQICGAFDIATIRIPLEHRRPDGNEWLANVENNNHDDYAWDTNKSRRAARLVVKTQVSLLTKLVTLLRLRKPPGWTDALSTVPPHGTRPGKRALQQLTLRILYFDTSPSSSTRDSPTIYDAIWDAPLSPVVMAFKPMYSVSRNWSAEWGSKAIGMEAVTNTTGPPRWCLYERTLMEHAPGWCVRTGSGWGEVEVRE